MTTMTTKSNAKFAFSKERYLEIMSTFSKFINSGKIKPIYHEDGHKLQESEASFEVFIFHAILKGKSPAITTHDESSERYAETLERLLSKPSMLIAKLSSIFGMTNDEVVLVIDVFLGKPLAKTNIEGSDLKRTIEICKHFRAFLKDKSNKPWKCERYGTKYPGKVTHKHFILYSLLRGKTAEITSHNPESDGFKDAILALRSLLTGSEAQFAFGTKVYAEAFGMTEDELRNLLAKV
ncbi:hypothetical protein [Vibrio owensii]|uniref:hypothetical protein n=1 Tax=Vibrio owensii TaxID=696485 RepID=UPI003CC64195